jgi:hypothetical protein
MTNEILAAAERTFLAAGCKPKDISVICARMEADHQVTFSVDGGLLSANVSGTLANLGTLLAAYRAKYPRDFYGESGAVNFKSDLADDSAAKSRYISEFGLSAWEQLPLNEQSIGAKHVVREGVPSAAMKRAEYLRLSIAERTKLAAELGPDGIGRIMSRR